MVDLETIIALATMTFLIKKNLYELHPTEEKVFNDFTNDKEVLQCDKIEA